MRRLGVDGSPKTGTVLDGIVYAFLVFASTISDLSSSLGSVTDGLAGDSSSVDCFEGVSVDVMSTNVGGRDSCMVDS